MCKGSASSYRIAERREMPAVEALAGYLEKDRQFVLPFLDWVQGTEGIVATAIQQVGVKGLEFILRLSARQVAGEHRPGERTDLHAMPEGDNAAVRRHGTQPGVIGAGDRKVRVARPRLRRKARTNADGTREPAREVPVPAYEAFRHDPGLAGRVMEMLIGGVSTRNYQGVIGPMAAAVGVSKSAVSREAIKAGAGMFKKLCERDFSDKDILVMFLDGLRFGPYLVLVAVGVDAEGHKHVLGVREGTSENATLTKELLEEIVARGVRRDRTRLYVIDGSKALRTAIDAVFGADNPVQRCRIHKARNIKDHLPEALAHQTTALLRAAYKIDAQQGIARVRRHAEGLREEYPSAAESILEGLEELFTVNRLGLPELLRLSFSTTNIIENNQSGLRSRLGRIKRWRSGQMVRRWVAAAALAHEKGFRRVRGHKQLHVLEAKLDTINQRGSLANVRSVA